MQSNAQYAKTLFDACIKLNHVSQIHHELKLISYLMIKAPVFRLVLITKRLSNQDKVTIISNTLIKFNPVVAEFLSIIISNNQSNNLIDIISKFNHLVNMHSNIQDINITTAHKLEESEIQSLIKSIYNILNTKPKISTITNPNIIGGIKLRIGNKIFDNSIGFQINQLRKTLHNL